MDQQDRKNEKIQQFVPDVPQLNQGGSVRWVGWIGHTFPAFQSRNYRLYFSGQLVSLIGTWLQIVAQGWLVLELTNSAFLIGLVTAFNTLPSLFFTLFGGVIVDRFPKKKVLIYTQSIAMILAFILGALTVSGIITVWHISVLAFLLGMVMAVDAPARQAFVAELVNEDQLSSAIALNSGTFNAARVIGPGIAGILIGLVGTGGAFLINACSYLGVIWALFALKIEVSGKEKPKTKAFRAIGDGLKYSFSHPVISIFLGLAGIVSVFGWSYTTVLPLIARDKFNLGADGLGYLYSATGLGSLAAAILVGAFGGKLKPVLFIFGGSLIFSLAISAFTLVSDYRLAMGLLFFAGFGLLAQASMVNTTVQRILNPEYRGRVMSLYVLMFLGMTPLGNLQVGWVSEHIGYGFAIRFGAAIVLFSGLVLLFLRKKILKAYHRYKEVN